MTITRDSMVAPAPKCQDLWIALPLLVLFLAKNHQMQHPDTSSPS